MWIHFTQDFDFKPKPTVTIACKAGTTVNVTRACGDAAIAAGKGEKAARPKDAPKGEDDEPNG